VQRQAAHIEASIAAQQTWDTVNERRPPVRTDRRNQRNGMPWRGHAAESLL
jgi:hypothetical protein